MGATENNLKRYEMLIDGEFVASSKMLQVVNPATEEVISEFPAGTAEDVDRAVLAAEGAQKSWAALPAIRRAGTLREIATLIRANREALARVITEEQGKILSLAQVEVDFSADYLDYMAEFARRYEGEIIQSDRPGENILLYKMPIGVIAGILPWNFPFFLIVRKMAPALVTGNTIVIKPSSETPNNAFEFARLVAQSSLPKGVFNLVSGPGSVVGKALAGHPRVGMVSLTGSVEGGVAVMHAAAENVTKVSLELGGKAPAIVMADADIDLAVRAIRASRIINTGPGVQLRRAGLRAAVGRRGVHRKDDGGHAADRLRRSLCPGHRDGAAGEQAAARAGACGGAAGDQRRRQARMRRQLRKRKRLLLPAHGADRMRPGDRHHAAGDLRAGAAHCHLRDAGPGHRATPTTASTG